MKLKSVSAVFIALTFAVSAHAADDSSSTSGSSMNFASGNSAKADAKATPAKSTKTPKADLSREAKKKKIEEKKKELNGSRWDITLTSGKDSPLSEELLFQDGKVSFKKFSDDGFVPSNYTISVPEGSEVAVWETMQSGEKGALLFVRGEWKDQQMTGVISQQNPEEPEKPAKDYSFTTQKRTSISPVSEGMTDKAPSEASQDSTAGNVLSSGPSLPEPSQIEQVATTIQE